MIEFQGLIARADGLVLRKFMPEDGEGLLRKNAFFRMSEGRPLWQDTLAFGLLNPHEALEGE